MSKFNSPTEIGDALSAPLGEFISSVGKGVAEAQQALDIKTVETFRKIYGDSDDKFLKILRDLGYQPTWYKIPEVEAKVAVSLNISGKSGGESAGGAENIRMYATPMDAGYANKYDYNLKAASRLTFKIVSVPPSAKAEEMKVAPNLSSYRYKDALALLDSMGIAHELKPGQAPMDDYFIKSASPAGGEVVFPGQKVVLEITEKI